MDCEVARGVATKFRLGGRIQVSQNHLLPNSDFSSGFGHFILDILENLTILTKIQKIFFKIAISGDIPGISNREGCVPHTPVTTPIEAAL